MEPKQFANALNLMSVCLTVSALVLSSPSVSLAAGGKKKNKPPVGTAVNIEQDGYYANKKIFCLKDTEPGMVKTVAGSDLFVSFKKEIKKATKQKNLVKLAKFKKMQSQGKKLCVTRPQSSIDQYKGAFGYAEAARLLRATGFGAPPSEVRALVAMGMDRAVDSIINKNVSELDIESQMIDLAEDTYFASNNVFYPVDEEEKESDPADENEQNDPSGWRTAMYHYFLRTQNQLQARLTLWAHDHFGAAAFRALNYSERHAIAKHMSVLRKFAASGNIADFLYDLNKDHLIARWLNRTSSSKFDPNEDYARELVELLSIGDTNPITGAANYGDDTIQALASVLTGYRTVNFTTGDYTSTYLAFSSELQDSTPRVIFAGTPYQAVVRNGDEVIAAILQNRNLEDYYADAVVREFVNGQPSALLVSDAAKYLRKSGLNVKELLRKLLKSKAFYAEDSRYTIFKMPLVFVMDVLRSSEMPIPHPREFLWTLDNLAQEFGDSPSVFGWHTYKRNFAGPRYVNAKYNLIMNYFDKSEDDLLENYNYDFISRKISDAPSADALVDRFALEAGIKLNAAQKASLLEFMNNTVTWQGQIKRDAYDSVRGSDNAVERAIGLMVILYGLPEFSVY